MENNKTNNHDTLRIFFDNIPLEKTSADFTDKIMLKLRDEKLYSEPDIKALRLFLLIVISAVIVLTTTIIITFHVPISGFFRSIFLNIALFLSHILRPSVIMPLFHVFYIIATILIVQSFIKFYQRKTSTKKARI